MVERSPERDAALRAFLPYVDQHGWAWTALVASGMDRLEAELLFPGGAPDLLEAYCDLADRDMEAAGVADQRLSQRVRGLIALRLAQARPHRAAIRRAAGLFAIHPRLAARCTARTVDTIWHAAGDTSADFSWYSKRAILAGVWTSTLLFWLSGAGEDEANVLEFLDRRLATVAGIGRLRARLTAKAA